MNLTVEYKGKYIGVINRSLVEKKGLTQEQIQHLLNLYKNKFNIYELMENENSYKLLQSYNGAVENLNFEIQKALKIPENRNFHDWYNVPKCQCPKKENKNNEGTEKRVYVNYCHVHNNNS